MHRMTSQKALFEAVKPLRVTVPVTPETKLAFERLAAAQGCSVGKAMGDWLRDTSSAADHMTEALQDVKTKPFEVALKLSGYASATSDMAASLVDQLRTRSKSGAARASSAPDVPTPAVSAQKSGKKVLTPPVSNTGGKVSGARTPRGSK